MAFASIASNLDPADADIRSDVFVRDLVGGTTTLVSRATGAAGTKGDGTSLPPDISADGRYVAFASTATNLDPADSDANGDVFVRDLQTGTTTLVSRATGSARRATAASWAPSISDDGRHVAFESEATNLDPLGDAESSNRTSSCATRSATRRGS